MMENLFLCGHSARAQIDTTNREKSHFALGYIWRVKAITKGPRQRNWSLSLNSGAAFFVFVILGVEDESLVPHLLRRFCIKSGAIVSH